MENNSQNKKQIFWNRKMIEKFIELYKENVCLYDASHENYNNQTVKTHALKNIAQKMQQYLPNLHYDDVEDKIKTIRTQLLTEISSVAEAESVGEKYTPTLWCFDQLEFLRDHLTTSATNNDSTKDNSFYEETHNVVNDPQSEDSDISVQKMPRSKSKRTIKIKWSRDDITNFIKIFKKYNILHNHKHKDFKKHKLRYAAYNKLVRETKKLIPLIELEHIRAKLHCFRAQYMKEVNYLKEAKKNNRTYIPKLWCFKLLVNLYNDESRIKSYINLSEDESSNDKVSISHLSETSNKNGTFKNELLEFEEIQVVDENFIEYQEESKVYDQFKTQNNEISPNTIDYESVNTFEYDSQESHDSPPAKKICYLENSDNDEMTEDSTKVERHKKSISNGEDANYDWLGELVSSQVREISQRYRTEFAWDVQCLLRKYILKSQSNQNETQPNNSSNKAADPSSQEKTVPQEIVLPRSSNVSFNISFV